MNLRNFPYLRIFLVVYGLLMATQVWSQKILDDTTKLIYGPRSTRFFFEEDLYYGKIKYQSIDTNLTGIHNYNYTFVDGNIYQNQGIIGSANQAVFRSFNSEIGYQPGLKPFQLFSPKTSTLRYFNTRSPFTSVYLTESGFGESVVKVDFSVNIGPRWNVGAAYQKIISEKMIDQQRQRDRQIDSDLFTFWTSYRSTNNKYHFLSYAYIMSHNALENGGFGKAREDSIEWFNRTAFPALFRIGLGSSNYFPKSFEKTTVFHLYQQYDLTKSHKATLFHSLDYKDQAIGFRQTTDYKSTTPIIPTGYYSNIFMDSTTTDQTLKWRSIENTFGVKHVGKNLFLSAYYRDKRTLYTQQIQTTTYDTLKVLLYNGIIGAEIRCKLIDTLFLKAKAEFQPLFSSGGHTYHTRFLQHYDALYRFAFERKRASIGYNLSRVSPSYFQTLYVGNLYQWGNGNTQTLSPTIQDQIFAQTSWASSLVEVGGNVQVTRYQNYIYFTENFSSPSQFQGPLIMYGIQGYGKFFWKFIGFNTDFRYTRLNMNALESPIRVPEWYVHPELYFQTYIFKKYLKIQTGLDVHYRTQYYADAYAPAIQSFYNQNSVIFSNTQMVNFFISAQIKRIRIFVRWNNIFQPSQNWSRQVSNIDKAFSTTPGYFGTPFSFVFGFSWSFYD